MDEQNKQPYEYEKMKNDQKIPGSNFNYDAEELQKRITDAVNLGANLVWEMNRNINSFSEQIRKVDLKPASEDLEKLKNSAMNLSRTIVRETGKGLESLSGCIEKTGAQYRPSAQKSRHKGPGMIKRLTTQVSNGFSWVLGGFSSVVAVTFGVQLIDTITGVFVLEKAMLSGCLMAGFTFIACRSLTRPARNKRLIRYLSAMGGEEVMPIVQLAETVQRPEQYVKKDLSRMIRKGFLQDGYIDDEEGLFFVSAERYREFQKQQEAEQRSPCETGNPAGQELLMQIDDFLAQLDKHIEVSLKTGELYQSLENLRRTTAQIRNWAATHPARVGRLRRLTSYYMPTALKLLNTYAEVRHQSGEAADEIRREVIGAVKSLDSGFAALHTALLTDTAMDVSAEVSVVETMLAQDGMSDPII